MSKWTDVMHLGKNAVWLNSRRPDWVQEHDAICGGHASDSYLFEVAAKDEVANLTARLLLAEQAFRYIADLDPGFEYEAVQIAKNWLEKSNGREIKP